MKKSQIRIINFFNADGLNDTKRIENGKTKTFKQREAAEKYRKITGSYIYDLYASVKNSQGREEKQVYGFAVPN